MRTTPRGESQHATGGGPSLPSDRAFVLQLHAEADPATRRVAGRIEHLASGDAEARTLLAPRYRALADGHDLPDAQEAKALLDRR